MNERVLDAKPHTEKIATGLTVTQRKEIAKNLGAVLADTMILQMKSQVYHWNVVGPLFYSLHHLTEEHYNNLFAAVDVIAERIRSLGHIAPLSMKDLAKQADLSEETGTRSAAEMVEQLVKDHERLI